MSIATTPSTWQLVQSSTTVRQFSRALLWVLGLVMVGLVIYGVEKGVLRLERRFAENPVEAVMRAFAMAHFTVGWLFLFTSPRIRNRWSLLRLGLATATGVVICGVFACFGALNNPWLVFLFYAYFLIHEVRDEAVLYRVYGDAPEEEHAAALLRSLSTTAVLWLTAVLGTCYLVHAAVSGKTSGADQVPAGFALAGVVVLWVVAFWAGRRTLRKGVQEYGDVRLFILRYLPLLWVYGSLLAILLLGTLLGSTGLNLLILIHVAAWLVFVQHQLGQRQVRVGWNLWRWLRGTPTGFLVLHMGLTVAFLALLAIRVYVWQRVGLASELLASDTFCYWSLMHISMSFWSSR